MLSLTPLKQGAFEGAKAVFAFDDITKVRIDQDPQLRQKSIPFVFYSTGVDQRAINEAYTKMTVQGFFQKSNSYQEIKKTIKMVIDYWMECKHPNVS